MTREKEIREEEEVLKHSQQVLDGIVERQRNQLYHSNQERLAQLHSDVSQIITTTQERLAILRRLQQLDMELANLNREQAERRVIPWTGGRQSSIITEEDVIKWFCDKAMDEFRRIVLPNQRSRDEQWMLVVRDDHRWKSALKEQINALRNTSRRRLDGKEYTGKIEAKHDDENTWEMPLRTWDDKLIRARREHRVKARARDGGIRRHTEQWREHRVFPVIALQEYTPLWPTTLF